MPNLRWLLALITHVHRWLYRTTGGRLGAGRGRRRFLLLEHVGRRSGQGHVTPLLYVEHAGRLVVAASNLGDRREPAWWLNLKQRPEAHVRLGPARFPVRVRRVEGAERAQLWGVLCTAWRHFPEYEERSGRTIPVVVLERTE